MKRLILFIFSGVLFTSVLWGQNSIELTFSAKYGDAYFSPDSIVILNKTQGGEAILYNPDSTLVLQETNSAKELENHFLKPLRVYPNPCKSACKLDVQSMKPGSIQLQVFDISGRNVAAFTHLIHKGTTTFDIKVGKTGFYFIKANLNGEVSTVKMFAEGRTNQGFNIVKVEEENYSVGSLKSASLNAEFPYVLGDELVIKAYSSYGVSGLIDSPVVDKYYLIQFATNMACPGIDSLEYEGQYYHTIQIFNQCWFKENLNVGQQINHTVSQSDNSQIEKYCLVNDSLQCERYGGLYEWDELMNYNAENDEQGICPEGWHVATDTDFKILEGAVDSNYEIGDSEWDVFSENGSNAGKKLKSESGWFNGGNGTDEYDFTLLWGGYLYQGMWAGGDLFGTFFTSTVDPGNQNQAITRSCSWMWDQVSRGVDSKTNARPARCVLDSIE